MANPEFDKQLAIRTLIDAALSGDRAAAKRAEVDERTLRRWRVRLDGDPELSAAFRAQNAAADRSWKAARRRVLGKLIRAIAKKVDDPDTTMGELSTAVKVLGELEITQGVLDGHGDTEPGQDPGEAPGRHAAQGRPSESPTLQ